MAQTRVTGSRQTTLPNTFADRAQVAAWLALRLPVAQRADALMLLSRLERSGDISLVPKGGRLLVRVREAE